MSKLDELAIKYGTDKQSYNHNYVQMYDFFFKSIEVNSLLEIGLGSGASVRMWLEYFPNSDIYCMEYFDEENKTVWNNASGNIEKLNLFKGDSTKEESWANIPNNLDVIIDDGSHFVNDQIATFMLGFNHLKKHGIYFIEDTHCGYEKKFGENGDDLYQWLVNLFMQQQHTLTNWGGNFHEAIPFIKTVAKDIYSYHIYKSCIVFEKA